MPAQTERLNYPFDEIIAKVKEMAQAGCFCYQKFTCSGCGNRLTMDVPNMIFDAGTCDNCDTVTDIEKHGCNFMLYAGPLPIGLELRPPGAPPQAVIVVNSKGQQ